MDLFYILFFPFSLLYLFHLIFLQNPNFIFVEEILQSPRNFIFLQFFSVIFATLMLIFSNTKNPPLKLWAFYAMLEI
jgi:hypothetical protein